jgi:nucleotide-binding universal stress UspA family protein
VFQHILVPVDLSDKNARMLRIALMLAERSGARVTLLHVVQQVTLVPPEELKGFYRRLVRTVTVKLSTTRMPFEENVTAIGAPSVGPKLGSPKSLSTVRTRCSR